MVKLKFFAVLGVFASVGLVWAGETTPWGPNQCIVSATKPCPPVPSTCAGKICNFAPPINGDPHGTACRENEDFGAPSYPSILYTPTGDSGSAPNVNTVCKYTTKCDINCVTSFIFGLVCAGGRDFAAPATPSHTISSPNGGNGDGLCDFYAEGC